MLIGMHGCWSQRSIHIIILCSLRPECWQSTGMTDYVALRGCTKGYYFVGRIEGFIVDVLESYQGLLERRVSLTSLFDRGIGAITFED